MINSRSSTGAAVSATYGN